MYLTVFNKVYCLHFLNQKVIIRRPICMIPRPLELHCNFTVPWAKEFIDTPICHEIYTFVKRGNNFLFYLAWLLGDANCYWNYYNDWKIVDFGKKIYFVALWRKWVGGRFYRYIKLRSSIESYALDTYLGLLKPAMIELMQKFNVVRNQLRSWELLCWDIYLTFLLFFFIRYLIKKCYFQHFSLNFVKFYLLNKQLLVMDFVEISSSENYICVFYKKRSKCLPTEKIGKHI